MKPGWIIGMLMLLVVMQLYCGVCEMNFIGGFGAGFGEQGEEVDTTGTILYLLQPEIPAYSNIFEGAVAWVSVPFRWVWSLLNCFFFNYSFLQGGWWIFRMFLLCISVGVVVAVYLALRGGGSVV